MGRRKRKPKGPPVFVGGRELTGAQVRALKDAAEAVADGRYIAAGDIYRQLEAEIAEGHERDWLKRKLAEIVILAEIRGEAVEISDRAEHKGRVRILSRDGLERLRYPGDPNRAPAISQGQYAAGLRYRDQFEKTEANLRSCMAGTVAGGGSPGGSADRAAQAKADVKAWDDAVFAAFPVARDGHDALLALREIAGRGKSLRDIASSGSRQGQLRQRLKTALDVVGDMLALH